MKEKKIFLSAGSKHYPRWIKGYKLVKNIDEADIVMFEGGADVDPELYGEKRHYSTYINKDRDKHDIEVFNEAIRLKKNMLGICRGNQFLTVMAGGKLIQDVTGHAGVNHYLTMSKEYGGMINITSTHHQMAFPYYMDEANYKVIAHSGNLSRHYLVGNNSDIRAFSLISLMEGKVRCSICGEVVDLDTIAGHQCFKEPEIIWYPKIKALGIQGHPEMVSVSKETIKVLNKLLDDYYG